MEIQIDRKTRLSVTDEYYAPMKRIRDKRAESGYAWIEYKWFTSLEYCICYLVQKSISGNDAIVSLKEFLILYREINNDVRSILNENGVV
jgi:hypothetical protein